MLVFKILEPTNIQRAISNGKFLCEISTSILGPLIFVFENIDTYQSFEIDAALDVKLLSTNTTINLGIVKSFLKSCRLTDNRPRKIQNYKIFDATLTL